MWSNSRLRGSGCARGRRQQQTKDPARQRDFVHRYFVTTRPFDGVFALVIFFCGENGQLLTALSGRLQSLTGMDSTFSQLNNREQVMFFRWGSTYVSKTAIDV